jgi:hypothetical protein
LIRIEREEMFLYVHSNATGSGLKFRIVLILMAIQIPVLACTLFGVLPTATPLPLPTELATTPLPEGSQLGGLEATFVSAVSVDGMQDERCYKLYRFYPDGLVLYADFACLDATPSAENWSEINRWFHRENRDLPSGDYYSIDHRLWIRIVSYDSVHETAYLRSFQGEYCNDRMVLLEPAIDYYAGVPSDLTEPVLEYVRLQAGGVEYTPSGACHLASFKVLFRPSVVLAGGGARYQIQTDPGETCSLQFTTPDGTISQAQGTGTITADANGICTWIWDVGTVEGQGTVRVTIGKISQDYRIEIR